MKYGLIVKKTESGEQHIEFYDDSHVKNRSQAEEQGKEYIDYFNSTLRPGESPREYIGIMTKVDVKSETVDSLIKKGADFKLICYLFDMEMNELMHYARTGEKTYGVNFDDYRHGFLYGCIQNSVGFIDWEGVFHECEYGQHTLMALRLLRKAKRELISKEKALEVAAASTYDVFEEPSYSSSDATSMVKLIRIEESNMGSCYVTIPEDATTESIERLKEYRKEATPKMQEAIDRGLMNLGD